MNYLLSFIHLLKWLFYPVPKPSMVGIVDTFAVIPRDTDRDWEGKVKMNSEENLSVTDTCSTTTVVEPQCLQNTPPPHVDENDIQSTAAAVLVEEVTPSTIVQELVVEAVVSPENLKPITPVLENETTFPASTSWITVQLQQQVTLANLHELQQELLQLLGKRVQLSGSQVQRVDTAALQLLVAFMHSAEVSVCWIDHSPALRQSARLLGLSTLLNLPE